MGQTLYKSGEVLTEEIETMNRCEHLQDLLLESTLEIIKNMEGGKRMV